MNSFEIAKLNFCIDGMSPCVTFPLAPAAILSKGLSHRMVVENKACGPPFQGRSARAEGCSRLDEAWAP